MSIHGSAFEAVENASAVYRRVREGLIADLYRLMYEIPRPAPGASGVEEFYGLYERCETLTQRLGMLVGERASAKLGKQVEIALEEGVAAMSAPLRREAARIMLGLDRGDDQQGIKPKQRLEAVQKLYADRGAERQNLQVLQRREMPEIREELADGLLEAEARFTRARRSDDAIRARRRGSRAKAVTLTWDEYAKMMRKLARAVRTAVQGAPLDLVEEDWASWCVVAVGRGAMPPATHLSHMLGIGMIGFASIWEYESRSGETRIVVDTLYTPAQDSDGQPRKFLVVDDVIDDGSTMQRIISELRTRYPTPIDVYQASLLRNTKKAGSKGARVFYARPTEPDTWYDLPWEGLLKDDADANELED